MTISNSGPGYYRHEPERPTPKAVYRAAELYELERLIRLYPGEAQRFLDEHTDSRTDPTPGDPAGPGGPGYDPSDTT